MFINIRTFAEKWEAMTDNRKKNESVTGIREACLVWGLPGVAILAISLLAAVSIGGDFGHDVFVRTVTFIGSNLLLWLLYALLFQMLPAELYGCVSGKKRSRPSIPIETAVSAEKAKDVRPIATETETVTDIQTKKQPVSGADCYAMRCEQHKRQCELEKANLVGAIIDYVNYIMPPYVDADSLVSLCGEIRMWAEDSAHKPGAVRLKGKLTTVDLRHFVWNIGERLGKENGDDGTTRAVFIKAMFPAVFKDTEIESIKNFKLNPKACRIPIDEPEDGNYAFHYPYSA